MGVRVYRCRCNEQHGRELKKGSWDHGPGMGHEGLDHWDANFKLLSHWDMHDKGHPSKELWGLAQWWLDYPAAPHSLLF